MDTALDDVAFLANSENRVTVFETLVEGPRSRDEIRGQVDASRVTVARILRELEAREWIVRSDQNYTITPLGEWVYEAFARLVDEIQAEHRVREAMQWFPTEQVTFDVQCLRDAEIILPDGSDATALVRRIVEFHRSGDHVRGLARMFAPQAIENHWEGTVHGDTRVELVIAPETLDAIRDHPPSARRFREMLITETAHYFIYEDIPISVWMVDNSVAITLTDEQGTLKGEIQTDDTTVHSWAVDLFETCRERAKPAEPDAITV